MAEINARPDRPKYSASDGPHDHLPNLPLLRKSKPPPCRKERDKGGATSVVLSPTAAIQSNEESETLPSQSMTPSSRTYLPAAGRDIFLPLYDPLLKVLGT